MITAILITNLMILGLGTIMVIKDFKRDREKQLKELRRRKFVK